jgi:hypothetical protein
MSFLLSEFLSLSFLPGKWRGGGKSESKRKGERRKRKRERARSSKSKHFKGTRTPLKTKQTKLSAFLPTLPLTVWGALGATYRARKSTNPGLTALHP